MSLGEMSTSQLEMKDLGGHCVHCGVQSSSRLVGQRGNGNSTFSSSSSKKGYPRDKLGPEALMSTRILDPKMWVWGAQKMKSENG